MDTRTMLYNYFLRALQEERKARGRGAIKTLAIDADMSRSFLSQILTPGSKKKASDDLQVKLAAACGYTLQQFLDRGKALCGDIEGKQADGSIAQSNTKGGGVMSDTDYLLQMFREELEAQRKQNETYRAEIERLSERVRELEGFKAPGKKTVN